MLGLKRHRPPFVVFAFTEGAFSGYSDSYGQTHDLKESIGGLTVRKFDAELDKPKLAII